MTEKPIWFAARLLFESNQDLFEERVILVRSSLGVTDAEKRAKKLAVQAEHNYENVSGQTVGWRFTEILDILELPDTDLQEGSEVYHHFLEPAEVEQVRQSLKPGSLR